MDSQVHRVHTWAPEHSHSTPPARRLPLTSYLIQVALFYFVSLLNNLAFGYNIPMPVHIIFRSGGLVVSMLMGWLLSRKSYTISQVLSVLVVTVGVILTTLSSNHRQETAVSSLGAPTSRYLMGIGILTLALILSGLLGVVQDKTLALYSTHTQTRLKPKVANSSPSTEAVGVPDVWQESMFYLHFLSLPLFFFIRHDLTVQARALLASQARASTFSLPLAAVQFTLPAVLPALLANTLTQLLCTAGVNRLTTRVPALTVTLVLVVRKAVSLVLSVVLFEGSDVTWACSGAVLSSCLREQWDIRSAGGHRRTRKSRIVHFDLFFSSKHFVTLKGFICFRHGINDTGVKRKLDVQYDNESLSRIDFTFGRWELTSIVKQN
ncbi:UAA transporter family-domain-containing protein [Russula aff. rugulosa BPL654]|nr:UAA transporter family-domain-containing protein [Russula aff. rugulosa BPL654]